MYNLVTAYVQPRGKWMGDLETDVTNMVVRDLFTASTKVILVLTHPNLVNKQTLDLADAMEQVFQLAPTVTFAQWFVALGSQSLPTREGLPTIAVNRVRSVQAFIAGFDVRVWDKGVSTTLSETTGPGNDLLLTRHYDGLDEKAGDYILASVNGAMHITDYTKDHIYIEGAGTSNRKSHAPSIMLHSFSEIGKVKQIPFSLTTYGGLDDRPMNKGIWIQLPEVIGNRTVMISLAGILYTAPDGWAVTGSRNMVIDGALNRLFKHYINTRDHIDWSEVEEMMALPEESIGGVYNSIFESDACLKAVLSMPQSFIIIIDNPNTYSDVDPLELTSLPGKYYSYDEGDYPVRLSNGLLPAIVPIRERVATKKPVWVLGCAPDQARDYYLYTDTVSPYPNDFQPDVTQSKWPFRYSSGYKLIIQSINISLPE